MTVVPRSTFDNIEKVAGLGSALYRKYRLYMQHVGIATVPESYESRLTHMFVSAPWQRLNLFALEANDLALSKLERNTERDRQDVLLLARAGHLNPHILKERYDTELRQYFLSKTEWHDQTLQLWIEMCWPSEG